MTVTTKITKRVKVFIDKYGKQTSKEDWVKSKSRMGKNVGANTNADSLPAGTETTKENETQ